MNTKQVILSSIQTSMVALLALGLLTSCSGFSRKNCEQTDWKQQGVIDGKKGLAAESIMKTEKSCSKKGSEFPISKYKDGWMEGIAVYCSAENGFKLASEGKKVAVNHCPIEFRPALEQNIKLGLEFAGIESKIEKLQKQKASMKDERQDVKEKMSEIENELDTLKAKKADINVIPAAVSESMPDPVSDSAKKNVK